MFYHHEPSNCINCAALCMLYVSFCLGPLACFLLPSKSFWPSNDPPNLMQCVVAVLGMVWFQKMVDSNTTAKIAQALVVLSLAGCCFACVSSRDYAQAIGPRVAADLGVIICDVDVVCIAENTLIPMASNGWLADAATSAHTGALTGHLHVTMYTMYSRRLLWVYIDLYSISMY